MEYQPMMPPFEIGAFDEMKKREAQRHLDWYVSEIPIRLELLKSLYARSGKNPKELDLSPESLIPLWSWFMPTVQTVQLSKREFEKMRAQYPEWIWDELANWEVHVKSLNIAMDIGIYFGEVMIAKYPKMKWGFVEKPKSYIDLNKPTIMYPTGADCCPSRILNTLTSKAATKESFSKELFEAFQVNTKPCRALIENRE